MIRTSLAVLIAALVAGASANAETTLRFNRWLPPTQPIQLHILDAWAKQVGEATGGTVKIEMTSTSLAPVPRQFDAVRDGIADVVFGSHPFTPARFPLHRVIELPFNNLTAEGASVGFWRVSQKFFAPKNEYDGIHLISHFVMGGGQFHTSKPIARIEDFQGMKIALAGGMQSLVADRLGVTSLAVPADKYFELLSHGTADGVALTRWAVLAFKLQDHATFHLEVPGGLYTSSFFIAMNQQKWDGLAAAERAAIEKISGEALARMAGQNADRFDREGLQKMAELGGKIVPADAEMLAAMKARLASLEDDWVAEADKNGVDGKAALAFLKETIASHK